MAQLNSELITALRTIAERRIVFVHQSVGRDMLQGVEELACSLAVACRIVDVGMSDAADHVTGIIHGRLGRNREPETKLAAFSELLNGPLGRVADAATVKLCYVDINAKTDVEGLFAHYRHTLQNAAERMPRARVFAMTVPLTVAEGALVSRIRSWAGRSCPNREANVRRHEFNELVRREFPHAGELFDVAAAEATAESGAITQFDWDKRTALAMYPPFTDDGGHLNERGRRHVAARFIRFLEVLIREQRSSEKHLHG